MATRTVGIALATYIDPNGESRFGLYGNEVEVHDDHVAEFDAANGVGDPDDEGASKKRPRGRRAPVKGDSGESADA